jgi:Cyclic nucleotide-binding domain
LRRKKLKPLTAATANCQARGCHRWIKPSSCSANVGCFAISTVGKKKHFSLASKFVILPPGETIFVVGSPGDSGMILLDGTVQISLPDQPHAALLTPGDIFGEIALLDGKERLGDAITIPGCKLAMIDRDDLLAFLEQNVGGWQKILSALCGRFRRWPSPGIFVPTR